MTESSQHTSKPQVEVEASGGDDNKGACLLYTSDAADD